MQHPEQKCAHFCSGCCIVGYGTRAFWDLWNWSIIPWVLFKVCICSLCLLIISLINKTQMQGTHDVCRNPIDWSNTMIHKSIFCENLVWIISNARVSSRTDNNENANVFWCFQIKHQHFYVNGTQGHYPRAMVRKVTAIHWPYSPGGSSGGDIVFKQSNIESRNHAIIHLCPISRDDILVD